MSALISTSSFSKPTSVSFATLCFFASSAVTMGPSFARPAGVSFEPSVKCFIVFASTTKHVLPYMPCAPPEYTQLSWRSPMKRPLFVSRL